METRSLSCWLLIVFSGWLGGCAVDRIASNPPPGLGRGSGKLFIVSTDFQNSGRVRLLDLSSGNWLGESLRINGDAFARWLPPLGEVWVINRFGADNLQPIEQNFTKSRPEHKVGTLGDLQDVVALSNGGLLVSSQSSAQIWEIDSSRGTKLGHYDLSELKDGDGRNVTDADGSPEPGSFYKNGDDVWVQLRRLNRQTVLFDPLENSYLAVLDTQRKTVRGVHRLLGKNPSGDFKTGDAGELYVAQAGFVGKSSKIDGLIEKWDLANARSLGAVVTERALGGDIVDFEILSNEVGVAIIANPSSKLVRFNPSTGRLVGNPIAQSDEYAYFQVLADEARENLFLVDRTTTRPRIRIFDGRTFEEKTDGIDPGLPAFQIGFVP